VAAARLVDIKYVHRLFLDDLRQQRAVDPAGQQRPFGRRPDRYAADRSFDDRVLESTAVRLASALAADTGLPVIPPYTSYFRVMPWATGLATKINQRLQLDSNRNLESDWL
jgi:hypothetical protein